MIEGSEPKTHARSVAEALERKRPLAQNPSLSAELYSGH